MDLFSISAGLPDLREELIAQPVRRQPLPSTATPFSARLPTAATHVAATSPAPLPPPMRAPVRTVSGSGTRDNAAASSLAERQSAGSSSSADTVLAPGAPLGWSGGGQSGQDAEQGQDELAATGGSQEMDTESLLDLLPIGGDSGIFEVILPGGETLGVVTHIRDSQASFLLTPGNERLRSQLKKKRMELKDGLERRMHRLVRLEVL